MNSSLCSTCRVGRSGVVLIIVVGLAAVLIAFATTFLVRMRSDAEAITRTRQQAQARLMLHAGLMYLQEASRLGWGGQAFGWTDLRDGSLGPKGIRPRGAAPTPDGLPQPSWWQASWPPYRPFPDDAELPPLAQRRWPCPGSAVRCPMPVWQRPPHAVQLRYSYNPITPPVAYGSPGWESPWGPTIDPGRDNIIPAPWGTNAYDASTGAMRALDPQPVAETWSEAASGERYASGAPRYVAGSEGRAWFRIYRETLADHDNDGTPYYDHVALHDPQHRLDRDADGDDDPGLANWNVFVITCGAGASAGFRFWDSSEVGFDRALEPVTASESGLFPADGGATFHALRASEQRMWFRVEWTGRQGGAMDGGHNFSSFMRTDDANFTGGMIGSRGRGNGASAFRDNSIMSYGGGFMWIQRLDREPERW